MLCFYLFNQLFLNRLWLFFVVLLTSFLLPAQDVIILQDGSEVKGKVTELGLTRIKYQVKDSLSNEILSLKNEDVFVIFFKNGQKRFISTKDNLNSTIANESVTLIGDQLYKSNYSSSDIPVEGILGKDYVTQIQHSKVERKVGTFAIIVGISAIIIPALATFIADITYQSELYNLKNYYVQGNGWSPSSPYSIGANMADLKTSAQFINVCVPIMAMGGLTMTTGVFLHFKSSSRLKKIEKKL